MAEIDVFNTTMLVGNLFGAVLVDGVVDVVRIDEVNIGLNWRKIALEVSIVNDGDFDMTCVTCEKERRTYT